MYIIANILLFVKRICYTIDMKPKTIGKLGEGIVADLLPGCNWVNTNTDKGLPFDIEWKDIYIDVKTTVVQYPDKALFNIKVSPSKKGYILVFLLIKDDESARFWVTYYHDQVQPTQYINGSLSAAELAEEILDIASLPAPDIKVSRRVTKQLSLNLDTYALLDKARLILNARDGENYTLNDTIAYLADNIEIL